MALISNIRTRPLRKNSICGVWFCHRMRPFPSHHNSCTTAVCTTTTTQNLISAERREMPLAKDADVGNSFFRTSHPLIGWCWYPLRCRAPSFEYRPVSPAHVLCRNTLESRHTKARNVCAYTTRIYMGVLLFIL